MKIYIYICVDLEEVYINIEGYIIVVRNLTTCAPPIHVVNRGGGPTEPGVAGFLRRHAPVRVPARFFAHIRRGLQTPYSLTPSFFPFFYSFVVMYRQN
jgi:hypothetical protein